MGSDPLKKKSMVDGGRRLARIKEELVEFSQQAKRLEQIEDLATRLIKKAGGKPSFKMVPGYKWSTCINVNSGIVHGIPVGDLKQGDVVTIDVGLFYKGFHTDTATSFVVGEPNEKQSRFLATGKSVLEKAIKQAKMGRKVKNISDEIQVGIENEGYSVVRELTGHGVGEELHQAPAIPCYLAPTPDMDVKLSPGMSIAIEVMYTSGGWPLKKNDDGWTLETKDGSMGAVFEESLFIDEKKTIVLTAI